MADFELRGPFDLTVAHIDGLIDYLSPGTFLLGDYSPFSDTFAVKFVGRSEKNLSNDLRRYVGIYGKFQFGYTWSPVDAYRVECIMYHAFNPADNPDHPARPRGSECKCPVCNEC